MHPADAHFSFFAFLTRSTWSQENKDAHAKKKKRKEKNRDEQALWPLGMEWTTCGGPTSQAPACPRNAPRHLHIRGEPYVRARHADAPARPADKILLAARNRSFWGRTEKWLKDGKLYGSCFQIAQEFPLVFCDSFPSSNEGSEAMGWDERIRAVTLRFSFICRRPAGLISPATVSISVDYIATSMEYLYLSTTYLQLSFVPVKTYYNWRLSMLN